MQFLKNREPLGIRGQILLIGGILLIIAFIPVAILMLVGMAPTIVAGLIDNTKEKVKSLTVGFLNFAGCYPYILLIINAEEKLDKCMELITDPQTIVIIYAAAVLGYLVEWAISGIVASIMVKAGERRLKEIEIEQKELIRRWGKEVTGDYPLDRFGYPINDKVEENPEEN